MLSVTEPMPRFIGHHLRDFGCKTFFNDRSIDSTSEAM